MSDDHFANYYHPMQETHKRKNNITDIFRKCTDKESGYIFRSKRWVASFWYLKARLHSTSEDASKPRKFSLPRLHVQSRLKGENQVGAFFQENDQPSY